MIDPFLLVLIVFFSFLPLPTLLSIFFHTHTHSSLSTDTTMVNPVHSISISATSYPTPYQATSQPKEWVMYSYHSIPLLLSNNLQCPFATSAPSSSSSAPSPTPSSSRSFQEWITEQNHHDSQHTAQRYFDTYNPIPSSSSPSSSSPSSPSPPPSSPPTIAYNPAKHSSYLHAPPEDYFRDLIESSKHDIERHEVAQYAFCC